MTCIQQAFIWLVRRLLLINRSAFLRVFVTLAPEWFIKHLRKIHVSFKLQHTHNVHSNVHNPRTASPIPHRRSGNSSSHSLNHRRHTVLELQQQHRQQQRQAALQTPTRAAFPRRTELFFPLPSSPSPQLAKKRKRKTLGTARADDNAPSARRYRCARGQQCRSRARRRALYACARSGGGSGTERRRRCVVYEPRVVLCEYATGAASGCRAGL
jgi:hypothetical protein